MASRRLSASLYVYSSERDRNSDMLRATDTHQTHTGTWSHVQLPDSRTVAPLSEGHLKASYID
jgi:hypothetical protein